ncbi:uncharacterized protein V2V93DRAFT_367424, partial [Kockiozyma suomiensis]|uniref:uncharacterized protein n=1 Tax=Kockiozyma suomiensis TaxID=1337062 RepID=UPI003343AF0E
MTQPSTRKTTAFAFLAFLLLPWLIFSAILTTSFALLVLASHVSRTYLTWLCRISDTSIFTADYLRERLARVEVFIAKLLRCRLRAYHSYPASGSGIPDGIKSVQQRQSVPPPSYTESEQMLKLTARRTHQRRSAQGL